MVLKRLTVCQPHDGALFPFIHGWGSATVREIGSKVGSSPSEDDSHSNDFIFNSPTYPTHYLIFQSDLMQAAVLTFPKR